MARTSALLAAFLLCSSTVFAAPPYPPRTSASDGNCMPDEEICMKNFSWRNEVPWECVDTTSSLENCGGCMNPMFDDQTVGRDCTIIPGQKNVACVGGKCYVRGCQPGWYMSKDRMACYEKYDEGD